MTAPTVVDLRYKPRAWQRLVHDGRKRFTVVVAHRRSGKTELALMELLDAAMRCDRARPGLFFYCAPYLKQARAIAWGRLKQLLEPLRARGAVDVNEGDLFVTFKHNGACIRLHGADNADSLRGSGLDGVVLDEVAWIAPEVWVDILQPALSDRQGWALFIGTPHGVNLFSELFFRAQQLNDWHAASFTAYDTHALDAAEVERQRLGMPESSFAREYLCDFSAAGDDQLISLSDVEVAARRMHAEQDISASPRVLGVDPARFGDDRSVIVKRQGLQMLRPLVYSGVNNMDLAGRVANVIVDWRPDACFIDSGAGAGVIDRLRMLGFVVTEVPFGGKATQPTQFVNRRTEMWWLMREWLERGGAIPNDPALKQELATPIYSFDASGRKVLESKDEIKKRLLGASSPDIADALALTFAAPVQRRDRLHAFGIEQRGPNARQSYNPREHQDTTHEIFSPLEIYRRD